MDNIFTVTPNNLRDLGSQESVILFRDLIWAEMRRCGIPMGCLQMTDMPGLTDGGIDAHLTNIAIPSSSSILGWDRAGFQIKSGGFKPTLAKIRNELFGKGGDPVLKNLKPAIKNVLDAGGAYVLVCFGWDGDQNRVINMIKAFLEKDYSNNVIEVWGQNTIIGQLQNFPSLCLRAQRREVNFFQTYKSWKSNRDMGIDYIYDEHNISSIKTIHAEIREQTSAKHIRIIGEPGLGKTRLVCEAIKENDLSPLVLYCQNYEDFQNGGLYSLLLGEDNTFNAVLVIDECKRRDADVCWNKLSSKGSRICLISINDLAEEKLSNTQYLQMEPLSDQAVERIFLSYKIPETEATHWAKFCEGIPSVAHIVAHNISSGEVDIRSGLNEVWKRYIAGHSTEIIVEKRTKILRYLALFRQFGYKPPKDNEVEYIYQLIKNDCEYNRVDFNETINELRKREILRGDYTLHITPSLLHIHLWCEWWENYLTPTFDYLQFTNSMPSELKTGFEEMFRYAHTSKAAQSIVDNLLSGELRPFSREYYTENQNGASFFALLTEASPEKALELLEKTILTWDKERLQNYTAERGHILCALQKIAVWNDLMPRAAKILLSLAEAENEAISNNATGVFIGLFNIVTSATEVPFLDRLCLLEEALHSESRVKHVIALKALESALSTHGGFRVVGPEYQGLRNSPQLWLPKTWDEIYECFREAWKIGASSLEYLTGDENSLAKSILLASARGLIGFSELSEEILKYLKYLADNPDNDLKKLLEEVLEILHYDSKRLSEDIKKQLELLRDKLTGDNFQSLLKRHAGSRFFIDSIVEGGQFGDASQPKLKRLAKEAISDISLIMPEMEWLVTKQAENGFKFGFELGKLDNKHNILPKIIDTMKDAGENATAFFLSGYLKSVYDSNIDEWEEILDRMVEDSEAKKWVPEITWRCGLTERAANRIMNIFCKDKSLLSYSNLFIYGGAIKKISETLFKKWLSLLIDEKTDNHWATALSLFCVYYINEPSEYKYDRDFAYMLLFSDIIIDLLIKQSDNPMTEFEWGKAAIKFIKDYPEKTEDIEFTLLKKIEDIFAFPKAFKHLLLEMVKINPAGLWSVLTSFLNTPYNEHHFIIETLLRGESFFGTDFSPNLIELFNPEIIWKWIDDDVPNRAKFLASVVPPKFFHKEDSVCLARELLVRYGNISQVRNNLSANFGTEGWKGPASEYFQNKKEKLEIFLSDEDNQNVRKWLNDYIRDLERTIEDAVINEERRGF